jgi:hypothetical protein
MPYVFSFPSVFNRSFSAALVETSVPTVPVSNRKDSGSTPAIRTGTKVIPLKDSIEEVLNWLLSTMEQASRKKITLGTVPKS